MSFIWRSTHPMVRRQKSLDAQAAARKEYYRRHPEELATNRAVSVIAGVILFLLLAFCSAR